LGRTAAGLKYLVIFDTALPMRLGKTMESSGTGKALTASQLGAGLFALFTIGCNFFPSLARALFPTGEVGDQNEFFLGVYLKTLPLSVALTAIAFIWLKEEFDNPRQRFWCSVGILVVAGFVGLSLGSLQVEESMFSKIHGPAPVVAVGMALYFLAGYAVAYGLPLFIAAIAASAVAGLWLHEKIS
jgi:hypothetical protein